MESMGERMQQGQQPGQRGRQGQTGQQGQQGQPQGQPGQQGGQQGQQGKQGQAGQQGAQPQDATGQGQPGNGGRNQGAPTQGGRNGEGENRGSVFNPNAGPRAGNFSPEDIRQFRGEARQRTADAEQLRRLLQQQKIDAKDLDDIIRGLKQLDSDSPYQSPDALAKLQSSVTDSVKRFEYTLRRRLDPNANQVFLSGSDEVPDRYRALVEQYYRALSKGGK